MTAENLVAEALGLPLRVRAFVAEKLIESLDAAQSAELSDPWREEVRKRCREMDEGLVELHDADDVFAKAYAQLA